jgi:RNA-directed DNA polymerase
MLGSIAGATGRSRHGGRTYRSRTGGNDRSGVAALEDKILQRAVVEVLNAVYEQDFLGFSNGFRPGRKPHDALDALAAGIVKRRVNWVLDADFREYFSSLDHQGLERFLEHRIADKRVLRLIRQMTASASTGPDGPLVRVRRGSRYPIRLPVLGLIAWRS